MKFSDNLRLLRTKHRLSQKEIGDIVGVTSQAVSKWENGIAEPDNDSLLKLSNYFNVSTDYLLGKSNEENQSIRYDDELEKVLFSKAKDLTDDEKKTISSIIVLKISFFVIFPFCLKKLVNFSNSTLIEWPLTISTF